MSSRIRHIAILIPARNEERLLPRCISSVLRAQAFLPTDVTSDVIVVADSCTDRTYATARRLLRRAGVVLTTNARNVGVARSLAGRAALARYLGPRRHCWLANTDADCEVPENWLFKQLILANDGAHAVAGIVDVDDFSEHHSRVADRFHKSYVIHADGTHPHVHGANIGFRADLYLGVGGWAHIETAEDHDLWNRLRARGCRQHSVAQLKVWTSGRRLGRAPFGFAGALAAHNEAFT